MTCGLVHTSYSLPEWQAVKVTVFAPCSMYPPYEPLRPECQCLMTERSWLWYQWNYFLYTKMYTTQIFVLKIGHTESNIMISPLLSRAAHMWLLMIPQNGKLARRPISHQNRNLWILIYHWILMVWSCWMLPLSCRCWHFVPVHVCVHSHEATEHSEHMGRVSSGRPASLDGLGSLYRRPRHGCTGSRGNFVFLAVSTF